MSKSLIKKKYILLIKKNSQHLKIMDLISVFNIEKWCVWETSDKGHLTGYKG